MARYSRSPGGVAVKRRKLDDNLVDHNFANEEARPRSWFGGRIASFFIKTFSPITNFWRSEESMSNVPNTSQVRSPQLRHKSVTKQESNGVGDKRGLKESSEDDNSRRLLRTSTIDTPTDTVLHSRLGTVGLQKPRSAQIHSQLSDGDDIQIIEAKLRTEKVSLRTVRPNRISNAGDDDVIVLLPSDVPGKAGVVSRQNNAGLSRNVDVSSPISSLRSSEDEEIKILEARIAKEDEQTAEEERFAKSTGPSNDDEVQVIGYVSMKPANQHVSPFLPAKDAAELRESYGLQLDDDAGSEEHLLSRHSMQNAEDQPEDVSTLSGSASLQSGVNLPSGLFSASGSKELGRDFATPSSLSPAQWNSASRSTTPCFSRASSGWRERADKFGRRKFTESSKLLRVRPQPFWSRSAGRERSNEKYFSFLKGNRLNKSYGGNEANNVINMDARERYRQLLSDLSANSYNIVGPSRYEARKQNSTNLGQFSSAQVLQRGRSVLDKIFSGTPSPISVSPSIRSENSSFEERSRNEGSETPKTKGLFLQYVKSTTSSGDSRKEDIGSAGRSKLEWPVWEDLFSISRRPGDINDSFEAKLETDKSTSMLARDRLERYKQETELRLKRAKALAVEKQLREIARRDEEITLEEEVRKKLTVSGYIFRDRRIKVEKDEFPDLDEDVFSVIDMVWYGSRALDAKFGERITRKDLMTLRGLDWLNDEVIDTYLSLVCERANQDASLPKTYAFTTFFYTNLAQHGFAKVKRWTKKVDIFSYDILLVPVHLGAHWCLAVIDFPSKTIEYFDSMGGSNNRCLSSLRAYLNDESMDKKKKPFNTGDWKCYCRQDIPQQMNGSDCGMFACKFAEFASRRAKVVFTQEHMPYFRQRMVYEIVKKSLL